MVSQAEVEDRTPNWEQKRRERDQEKEVGKEEKGTKQPLDRELNVSEEKAKILRDGKPKISKQQL